VHVLVAMSGGVDSSVAAALLRDAGHDVVGVTMRLWGGPSDQGCCSASDVDDARRVAQQLGIDHVVFNFSDDFEGRVVGPYVAAHARGLTPNPCIECNRHLKFDRLLERARRLGFDAVATGHHARVVDGPSGPRLARGVDRAKDQSYVLHMLTPDVLREVLLPVGHLTKADVRAHATALGLRTAAKAESQDVCFIGSAEGRRSFLGQRIPLRAAQVEDLDGRAVGRVPAVELVTVGQRKGLGLGGTATPRYAVQVDVAAGRVVVGEHGDLLASAQPVHGLVWAGGAPSGEVLVQCSAHGRPRRATVGPSAAGNAVVHWSEPQRRVAPGQAVVVYDRSDELVVGGGVAAAP
jgi:tRNA-specific 2-thiouridylase